jgi:hypothetical protein
MRQMEIVYAKKGALATKEWDTFLGITHCLDVPPARSNRAGQEEGPAHACKKYGQEETPMKIHDARGWLP